LIAAGKIVDLVRRTECAQIPTWMPACA
jgi:hypothetical protein